MSLSPKNVIHRIRGIERLSLKALDRLNKAIFDA